MRKFGKMGQFSVQTNTAGDLDVVAGVLKLYPDHTPEQIAEFAKMDIEKVQQALTELQQ